ncbi:NUDIX domain-containing protein [Candidatus Woesearchaeota archaeon]|nr:NUDIX domain-containing protein [Candidatus Woesearchaeota archaeon]
MPKTRPQCGLILENSKGEVILQERDNNPDIPYPGCLGTFGGEIDAGETPEQSIVREIWEELRYRLQDFQYFGNFPFEGYDIHMFRKVDIHIRLEDLIVREGERAVCVPERDITTNRYRFAFNCQQILAEYFKKLRHPQ